MPGLIRERHPASKSLPSLASRSLSMTSQETKQNEDEGKTKIDQAGEKKKNGNSLHEEKDQKMKEDKEDKEEKEEKEEKIKKEEENKEKGYQEERKVENGADEGVISPAELEQQTIQRNQMQKQQEEERLMREQSRKEHAKLLDTTGDALTSPQKPAEVFFFGLTLFLLLFHSQKFPTSYFLYSYIPIFLYSYIPIFLYFPISYIPISYFLFPISFPLCSLLSPFP